MKSIVVTEIENRPEDGWFDIGLRSLRAGEARIYRVKDLLTGDWLFKVCSDPGIGRYMVKALKCPPGKLFSQLEGATMLFQKSEKLGLLYDIVSSSYVDKDGRVRRNIIDEAEKMNPAITENFTVKTYEEATGKVAIGKRWVTLTEEGDEKAITRLFIIERAWPLSSTSLEVKKKVTGLLDLIKELEKASLEDVYAKANSQLNLNALEVDDLVKKLVDEGRLRRIEDRFLKT